MNRSDFQNATKNYVDESEFFRFKDILDFSRKAMLTVNPEIREKQKTTDDWLGEEIHWLELSCWVEMENDTIEFYGIKPSGVNLKTREFMDQIPGIPTGGRSEKQTQNGSFPLSVESLLGFTPDENTSFEIPEQPFDWDRIHSIIKQYNNYLGSKSCAPPFMKMSLDETRTNSMYYKLLTYDYETFQLMA